jgi:hypothetical protein
MNDEPTIIASNATYLGLSTAARPIAGHAIGVVGLEPPEDSGPNQKVVH